MADDDDKPPHLKVVSDNPNARVDRQIESAKGEVERALSQFAAALLRTMAGNDTEAVYLVRHLSHVVDALNKFRERADRGLSVAELQEALRLPEAEMDYSGEDESRHRHWLRAHAMDLIVKGALRLAAHKVLGEEPAFGGMHSTRLIRDGIEMREQARKMPVRPPPSRKPLKAPAAKWIDAKIDLGPPEKPPTRKKPWSSRDSVSYRDLKPQDK